MKILVTGATGFVGQKLCERLKSSGHQVVALARHGPVACDLLTQVPSPAIFDGVEAIVHLAGESVSNERWSIEKKKRIHDSRVIGSRNLLQAVESLGAKRPSVIVSASAIGYYGDRGDEVLTESSLSGKNDFIPEVCQAWEDQTIGRPISSVRQVALRVGVVLGREGGALEKLWPLFRAGLGGPVGPGQQWMSWIHVDDLVSLIEFSIFNPAVSGPINAVAPHPETNRVFSETLASVVGKKSWLRVPAWFFRATLGERSNLILVSQRVMPRRALEFGFRFQYPELKPALIQLNRESQTLGA